MTEPARGVVAMVAACTIWGLSPIYYKLLVHVPAIEVLAHRTLWSVLFFAGVLLWQGRIGLLRRALGERRSVAVIATAAVTISVNWFVFITAIQIDRAVEASLGYYMFPLVAVLLGATVFRERLQAAQWTAVTLAVVAVTLLAAGLGVAPWISLVLAGSFGLYGLAKKGLFGGPGRLGHRRGAAALAGGAGGPVVVPRGAGRRQLRVRGPRQPASGLFGDSHGDAADPVQLCHAARRLATVGLVQYLNPTLQFLVATLIFREAFSGWHAAAFGLIWTALAIYTLSAWRQDRAARRAASSSSTVSATPR